VVAAVFAQLGDDIPSGWVAVARWVPADPAARAAEDAGSELVFSAPGGAPAAELRAAMQRFAATLPRDQRVLWTGAGGG
jgi:hypothetical protein